MFSFDQEAPSLTARSPHPITMGPPAGIWLKESPTIMKNESWSISEPAGRRYVELSGKPWKLGSSSEIILQNRSSDSLHSESLTWLPRRSHNPTLSRTSSLAQHTTATSHQKLTAQSSQDLCSAVSSLRPGESWLWMVLCFLPSSIHWGQMSLLAKVPNSVWG